MTYVLVAWPVDMPVADHTPALSSPRTYLQSKHLTTPTRLISDTQKRAEEEAESMRKRVMEELARMEDEARKSIEEEVRKMQMLQVLMQQEAMIKMETAMREKMAEIQASSTVRSGPGGVGSSCEGGSSEGG